MQTSTIQTTASIQATKKSKPDSLQQGRAFWQQGAELARRNELGESAYYLRLAEKEFSKANNLTWLTFIRRELLGVLRSTADLPRLQELADQLVQGYRETYSLQELQPLYQDFAGFLYDKYQTFESLRFLYFWDAMIGPRYQAELPVEFLLQKALNNIDLEEYFEALQLLQQVSQWFQGRGELGAQYYWALQKSALCHQRLYRPREAKKLLLQAWEGFKQLKLQEQIDITQQMLQDLKEGVIRE